MQGMLHRLSDGSEEEVTVGTKLYVGSLPYTTTDQQLQELFAQHGTVSSAKVISDRYTGRSRGFGFVEMATSEDAQKAIAALNGTQYEGRALVVNEAKPQEKRERSSWGGGGGEGGGRGGGGGRR
jgi:RNA recognition motif-containing protein